MSSVTASLGSCPSKSTRCTISMIGQLDVIAPAQLDGGARRPHTLRHHDHARERLLQRLAATDRFPQVSVAAVATQTGNHEVAHPGKT